MLKVNPMTFNNLSRVETKIGAIKYRRPQLRNLCEETRTANARIAPEVVLLQAREAQLSNRVSRMQSQETELEGQLENLLLENTQINDRLKQIQVTRDSIWTLEIEDGRSNCRRQASNSVAHRLEFLTCELRWCGISLPKIETQTIFEIWGKIILPLLEKIFGNRPRLNDFSQFTRSRNWNSAYSISMGRRAKYFEQLESRCRRNAPNRCRIRIYYSIDCHTSTPLEAHLGLLFEISVASAVSSSAFGLPPPMAGRNAKSSRKWI